MITPSQPHVTNLPLHVRNSNQPIGLFSSFRNIQPRKNETQNTGVQNVFSHHRWSREAGCSCHARCVLLPARLIARSNVSIEKALSSALTQSNCPVDVKRV